jgi:hypothetical protein
MEPASKSVPNHPRRHLLEAVALLEEVQRRRARALALLDAATGDVRDSSRALRSEGDQAVQESASVRRDAWWLMHDAVELVARAERLVARAERLTTRAETD